MRALLLCCAVLFLGPSFANAAPPADCAWKFVGTWQSTFTPNGHQSTATIKADGTQGVNCAGGGCVSSLNWTCSGDTHIVGSARSKLSPDGKRMTWRLGYSVRLTRVPAGLVGEGKDPFTGFAVRGDENANGLGNSYMTAGAAAEQYCTYADQIKAAEAYSNAARFFEKAGNEGMHRKALAAIKRTDVQADYCEGRKNRKLLKKVEPKKKKADEDAAKCAAVRKEIRALAKKAKGGDDASKKYVADVLRKLKSDVRKMGC